MMLKKYIIMIVLYLIYRVVFPDSFIVNIVVGLLSVFILIKFLEKKGYIFLKRTVEGGIFIIAIFFIIGLGVILNDIYKYRKDSIRHYDYVFVLGCSLKEDKPRSALQARLDKSYEYLQNNPNTKLILCGGQGFDEIVPESLAMKNYLLSKGVSSDRLIEENKSRTTYENLKYASRIVGKNRSVGVITNDFHMYRVKRMGDKLKLNLNPIYAKTPLLNMVSCYSRESLSIIYNYCRGRI